MSALNDIGLKHQTDKSSMYHDYLRIYHHYFTPYRYDRIHLLEIGIAGGASLQTWLEFFPEAKITGLDHNAQFVTDVQQKLKEQWNNRCVVIHGEASSPEAWKGIREVDILIDDASHYSEPTLTTFDLAFPLVKPGGLYIIEDLHQMLKVEPQCKFFTHMDTYAKERLHEMGNKYCAKRFVGDFEWMHWYKSLLVIKKR